MRFASRVEDVGGPGAAGAFGGLGTSRMQTSGRPTANGPPTPESTHRHLRLRRLKCAKPSQHRRLTRIRESFCHAQMVDRDGLSRRRARGQVFRGSQGGISRRRAARERLDLLRRQGAGRAAPRRGPGPRNRRLAAAQGFRGRPRAATPAQFRSRAQEAGADARAGRAAAVPELLDIGGFVGRCRPHGRGSRRTRRSRAPARPQARLRGVVLGAAHQGLDNRMGGRRQGRPR